MLGKVAATARTTPTWRYRTEQVELNLNSPRRALATMTAVAMAVIVRIVQPLPGAADA
jgi:hypothetical protein